MGGGGQIGEEREQSVTRVRLLSSVQYYSSEGQELLWCGAAREIHLLLSDFLKEPQHCGVNILSDNHITT